MRKWEWHLGNRWWIFILSIMEITICVEIRNARRSHSLHTFTFFRFFAPFNSWTFGLSAIFCTFRAREVWIIPTVYWDLMQFFVDKMRIFTWIFTEPASKDDYLVRDVLIIENLHAISWHSLLMHTSLFSVCLSPLFFSLLSRSISSLPACLQILINQRMIVITHEKLKSFFLWALNTAMKSSCSKHSKTFAIEGMFADFFLCYTLYLPLALHIICILFSWRI